MPVISGCDTAEVLEPAKHPLDCVSVSVKRRRETVFPLPVLFGRNIGQQDFCTREVGNAAAGQVKGNRPSQLAAQGVDLGGWSTTRTANRLVASPPLSPWAERCARTADESIIDSSMRPSEALRVSNSLLQTPLSAHLTTGYKAFFVAHNRLAHQSSGHQT